MNIEKKIGIIIGGAILTAVALTACFGSKSETAVEKQVQKPVLSRAVVTLQSPTKGYSVSNLSVDPSQVIFFNTEVSQNAVELTIQRLRDLDSQKKDVYLILDSPGGSVFDGSRLIAYMEGARIKIHTICYSLCASMAAQIHAHGSTRYVIDHSTLMYHQAAGGVQGSLKEMKNQLAYVDIEVAKLDAYIANRAGIPRETFDKMVEHELWIAADDAVDKKLADKLVVLSLNKTSGEVFRVSNELTKKNLASPPTISLKNPLQQVF